MVLGGFSEGLGYPDEAMFMSAAIGIKQAPHWMGTGLANHLLGFWKRWGRLSLV